MRPLKRNSIPLALCVFAALLTLTQFTRAQSGHEQTVQIHEPGLQELGLQELGLHELRAREQEALARHARELQALERARHELRLRDFDAASRAGSSQASAIPDGALGIVQINRPREMTLLHLRGLVGSGSALLRLDQDCISIPLRFVAGDFGGESFSARRVPPIRIAVQSVAARDALLEGEDLVSDSVEVGHVGVDHVAGAAGADLVLLDGLTLQHGFVINPGRSLVDDVFGVQGLVVPCTL